MNVNIQNNPAQVKVKQSSISAENQDVRPANGFANIKERAPVFSDDDEPTGSTGSCAWGGQVQAAPSVPSYTALIEEAKTVHKNWRDLAKTVPWERYLPSLQGRANEIKRLNAEGGKARWNVVFDLLRVPLKKLIADIKKQDPDRKKYGFLPYMAKTWLGRLMAESFSERMLSNANIVITPGNMRLDPVEMEQLVVLRMNREFMASASDD